MKDENRIPVIIGTGQLVDRNATIERYLEPLEMLTQTAQSAVEDAGAGPALLKKLDTIALVGIVGWHPQNAPGLLGEQLGAHPANEFTTGTGGQMGVSLTNLVAGRIVNGESELALVGGSNNLKVLMKARSENVRLPWARGGQGQPELVDGDEAGTNKLEEAYGMQMPPDVYPLFENALRAKLGLSIEAHRKRMGDLFEQFTRVAVNNPYAWFPVERSSAELTRVTETNRMISWPYTKYLNAILNTEQAASLLVCSVAKARAMGIPERKWVYWWGGAKSQEEAWWTSERPNFAACPSMQDTMVSTLVNAGVDISEINHIDFYSCFPVAVEMACEVLGLDVADPRGFTVTGGLPYAGGPASAYTLHSLATMVNRLRDNPGHKGLVTGNGWYLTKHSAAVLSSAPKPGELPTSGLLEKLPSADLPTEPVAVTDAPTGEGMIETYTVAYARDGRPNCGIVLGRTASGQRFLANTPGDPLILEEFVQLERVGQTGQLRQQDGKTIFDLV
jgi:acetyl-CoA C-acetyltransferase